MVRRWSAVAAMLVVAAFGCTGAQSRDTGAGTDPSTIQRTGAGSATQRATQRARPGAGQRTLIAIAVAVCVVATRPADPAPTGPQPAPMPEPPDAAMARCVRQLRTTLESLRSHEMYQPDVLRTILTDS